MSQKNIDSLVDAMVNFPDLQEDTTWLYICYDECVTNDFPEGLRLLLSKQPKCIHRYRNLDASLLRDENDEIIVTNDKIFWNDPHLDIFRTAVSKDHIECVRVFLEHGCDPNGGIGYEIDPPFLSVQSIDMAKLMISYGADINICNIRYPYDEDFDQEECIFGILCEGLCHLKTQGSNKITELMLFLLNAGIERDLWEEPIKYLYKIVMWGHLEALKFFHKELGFDLFLKDNEGHTLLHYATTWGQFACIPYLLENGLPDVPNKFGFMATYYATKRGDLEIVKYIEDFGLCLTKRAK